VIAAHRPPAHRSPGDPARGSRADLPR
jgi:hypothetical protein